MKNAQRGSAVSLLIGIILVIGITVYIHSRSTQMTTTQNTVAHESSTKTVKWASLEGKWVRQGSDTYDYAEIDFTNITPNQLLFNVSANNGANQGQVDDVADIKGDTATFISKDATSVCILTFTLSEQAIKLKDRDLKCAQMYAGNGVFFDGDFARDVAIASVSVETAFKNKSDSDVFKQLVGTNISLFNDTAQNMVPQDDLDNLNAAVYSFFVRGLGTENESIIMIAPHGKIAAAVIDPSTNVVRYFTNISAFTKSLPKTIDAWRNNFKEDKIIFQ